MLRREYGLSDSEIGKLRDATMDILNSVGVAFYDSEALDIFKKQGAKVSGNIVCLSEGLVEKALDTAPSKFTITARNPLKNVLIGDNGLALSPAYGAPYIITESGDQRKATLEDYNNFCKLVHISEIFNLNGFMMVSPWDVPAETAHLDMQLSNTLLSDKPFMTNTAGREASKDAIDMAGIVWGGKKNLRDMPVMIPLITALSPLQYATEATGTIIELARYGQPLILSPLGMAGSTAPITPAGLLALQGAEILAAMSLAQFVHPGTPVVYGGMLSPLDMRTGNLSVGAAEYSMALPITAQLAQAYGLPSRGGGCLTDAHVPDIQAGIEATLALSMAVSCGLHMIGHACGELGAFRAMSFEKFILDEEICKMVLKTFKPLEVTDETIDLDAIKEVGIGGEYLTHPKTFERCRTEFLLSDVMNRQDYADWEKAGKRRADEKSRALLEARLTEYNKPDIDPEVEQDLIKYVKRRKGL